MTNAETVNVEIRTLTDVRTDEPSSREQTKTDDAAKAPTGPNMSAITLKCEQLQIYLRRVQKIQSSRVHGTCHQATKCSLR